MFLHSDRSLLQTVRVFFRIFQIVLKVFLFPIWSVLPSFSTSETSVINLEKFVYEARIDGYGKTLHRTTLVKIPYPKFVVFYNGDRETEDRELLRLSDAFEDKEKDGDFEWTAELININSDHNKTLQKNCKPLYDYVRYVSKIKENKKHDMTTEEAVNKAVDWAIKENLLDGFFKIQKEEVLGMSLTEYDEEEYLRDSFQEGVEVGQAEGIQKKAIDDAIEFLKEEIAPEIIAKCVKLPLEQVLELKKSITVPV